MLELAPKYITPASGSIKDTWGCATQGSPSIWWQVSHHYNRVRVQILRWILWGLHEEWSGV